MTIAHAKLSASGAKRWLNCAGSVALTLQAPPQPSSPYAEEGTRAHAVLEELLKSGPTYSSVLAQLKLEHPEEMVNYADMAFREIVSRSEGADDFLSETKVSLEFIQAGMFGTVDAAIIRHFDRLTVIDFKYGQGIVVDPEDNEQLIYYALGIAHEYDYNFSEVEIVIIQPRAQDERGPIREWTTSIETLKDWAKKFSDGAKACSKTDAPLNAGSWCRFCPAASICPEISTKALKSARLDFSSELKSLAVPAAPSIEDLPFILDAAPKIEAWLEAVKDHAFDYLKKGGAVPGYKLVEKRGTRKWLNPLAATNQAAELFGDQAFTEPELLSPAQLEKTKLAGVKDFTAHHAAIVSTGLTMVEWSDKREAVTPAINDFSEDMVSESDWKQKEKGK